MFSVNVPVPGAVHKQAAPLQRHLGAAARTELTLVAKRLPDADRDVIRSRVRRALADTTPFAARTTGVDTFTEPETGSGIVVFLVVDSPGLETLHQRLCSVVDPEPAVEGEDYVPHVTVGRTADEATIETVLDRSIEPVEWTVSTLEFFDATTSTVTGRIHLDE